MSAPKFKVGDRVQCVSVAAPLDPLTVGGDYVVQGIDPDMGFVRVIADDGRLGGWFSERFVLATTPPPRDLNPFEWDERAMKRNMRDGTGAHTWTANIEAFARWLWAVTGLPFTFGDTPDTVTVELDRDLVEAWAQPQPHRGPMITALSDACRAALDGENGS